MQIETRMSDQLARYLDMASNEAKLTAANIANIDTPGYRALGFDFETEIAGSQTDALEREESALASGTSGGTSWFVTVAGSLPESAFFCPSPDGEM